MAFRHLYLLFLLPLTLFSQAIDFRSCQLKYEVSSIYTQNTTAFAVDDEFAIFYSKKIPSIDIVKRDPYLGLNLIEAPKPFKHKFKFYINYPKQLAGVLPEKVQEGKVLKRQIGLNKLGKFSKQLEKNSIISGTCCGIIGIATENGFIEKEYIRHFLKSKEVSYSGIGIRLKDYKGVRVYEVNPFFENIPFLVDDVILFMDKKKAKSAAQVSMDILFSKPNSTHYFIILRDGKKLKLKAKFKKRVSGGLVSDSFFNLFGLELDENLVVKRNAPKYEIKKGDKLLFVMGKEVKSLSEVRKILTREKQSENKMVVLLFKRNDFDFFIHFPKP